jgi:hypothetical protein
MMLPPTDEMAARNDETDFQVTLVRGGSGLTWSLRIERPSSKLTLLVPVTAYAGHAEQMAQKAFEEVAEGLGATTCFIAKAD